MNKMKTRAFFSKASHKLQKAGPTIGVTAGVVGFGATVFLASKATLKLGDIVDAHKEEVTTLTENYEEVLRIQKDDSTPKSQAQAMEVDEQTYAKAHLAIWLKTTGKVLKLYGPAIAVGSASIVSILYSHKTMSNRLAGAVAAYNILQQGFQDYRDRIVKEVGEEKEAELYDESVSTGVFRDKVADKDGGRRSQYSRFFDELNPRWTKNATENRILLSNVQNYYNDLLRARGHVFLNEVYETLGFDRTPEGQVVGWYFSGDEATSNFIDFGIFDSQSSAKRAFVNGDEHSVILDFNVDGVILDEI